MLKDEFFRDLQHKLKGLPAYEREQIMQVYEDLFKKAAENGKHEREVAESLGYLSSSYCFLGDRPDTPAGDQGSTQEQGVRTLLASVALGLFNLIFVLFPFLGFTLLLFLLGISSILFIGASVLIWFFPFLPMADVPHFFLSLMLFGLGMLTGLGASFLFKIYFIAVRKYIQININLIRGQ